MAYQPVPNVAQCQIFGVVDGQVTINDLYFEISGGGITPINLSSIATALSVWGVGSLAPLLSDDWTMERVIATDLTTATGPRVDIGGTAPGGVSGEALPNNVAACVSLRTALRGRSARGRNYVPGIPSSLCTLNTLDPTFVSDLVTAYNGLVGAGTFLAGWELVVVSRQTAGALRPTGLAIPVVSALMTTDRVRSMRSREVGHGA
jgi:hypothetical protein